MNLEKKIFKFLQNKLKLKIKLNKKININKIPCWDSVAHINILLQLEKEFGIKITFEEGINIKKISDIIKLVNKKL